MGVAAVIIGARNRSDLTSNVAVSCLALSAEDLDLIAGVLAEIRELEDDVYGLERDTETAACPQLPFAWLNVRRPGQSWR
ncbi:hypothetical protein ACWGTI_32110 [Mesorhizobium sp. ArgA1]